MNYFFERLLDGLPMGIRTRLWDLIFLFLQDDDDLSLVETVAADSPSLGSADGSWLGTGARGVSKPK